MQPSDLSVHEVTKIDSEGCIMLHSVSTESVQECGMRQVVTSCFYSVTEGGVSGTDGVNSLFVKQTQH